MPQTALVLMLSAPRSPAPVPALRSAPDPVPALQRKNTAHPAPRTPSAQLFPALCIPAAGLKFPASCLQTTLFLQAPQTSPRDNPCGAAAAIFPEKDSFRKRYITVRSALPAVFPDHRRQNIPRSR